MRVCVGGDVTLGTNLDTSWVDRAAAWMRRRPRALPNPAELLAPLVPLESVRLTVDHGWVTLQGDVEWDYQRRSVEKAIRPLMGVVGISNEITLRSVAKAADLSRKIQEALTRQAIREAKHIQVGVDGTTVKLSGTVHSWQERDAAQGVAWSAPGVQAVVDELRVG